MSKAWIAVGYGGTVAVFSGNQGAGIEQIIEGTLQKLEASPKMGREIEMFKSTDDNPVAAAKVMKFMEENGLGQGERLTDC